MTELPNEKLTGIDPSFARLECLKLCGPLTRSEGVHAMIATANVLYAYVASGTGASGNDALPADKPKRPR